MQLQVIARTPSVCQSLARFFAVKDVRPGEAFFVLTKDDILNRIPSHASFTCRTTGGEDHL